MILLHVTQTLKNRDERDRYYAKLCASGIPDASRGEDGNLGYDYFFPADTDNRILLIEKWESDEALTRTTFLPFRPSNPSSRLTLKWSGSTSDAFGTLQESTVKMGSSEI